MNEERSYIASITREPFLLHEMRITAQLMASGSSDAEIIEKIYHENLYQYPTERSLKTIARGCIKRLRSMENEQLIHAIATGSSDVTKQLCLYALLKQSRLFWEFMVTVIAEKYRVMDYAFGKIDLNLFFIRLQEQHDDVSGWSDKTITKLKQVFTKILVETGYLDSISASQLNIPVLHPILEDELRAKGDTALLSVFNRFV